MKIKMSSLRSCSGPRKQPGGIVLCPNHIPSPLPLPTRHVQACPPPWGGKPAHRELGGEGGRGEGEECLGAAMLSTRPKRSAPKPCKKTHIAPPCIYRIQGKRTHENQDEQFKVLLRTEEAAWRHSPVPQSHTLPPSPPNSPCAGLPTPLGRQACTSRVGRGRGEGEGEECLGAAMLSTRPKRSAPKPCKKNAHSPPLHI